MNSLFRNRLIVQPRTPLKRIRLTIGRVLDRLPVRCVVCGHAAMRDNLCDLCLEDLPRMPGCCTRCALPISAGTVCGPCIVRPPPWHLMRCASPYATPVDTLISRLKFGGHKSVAPALATLLVEAVGRSPNDSAFAHLQPDGTHAPDLIVPVPLHWRRLWQRGFNQSAIVAHHVSLRCSIPVAHVLVRLRHTRAQRQLGPRQRHHNVRNAFQVSRPVAGKHVALIDDVITTGATVDAAARELRAAGAASVSIWACARAFKDAGTIHTDG